MPATTRRPSASRPAKRAALRQFDFPELGQDVQRLVGTLREGLPADRVTLLSESLGVPFAEVLGWLAIPPATMARRTTSGRLDRDESERTYRLARLIARASEVFGSLQAGREWLTSPQYALGGPTPLAFADTEPGAREVEHLLGRIEHGIPV